MANVGEEGAVGVLTRAWCDLLSVPEAEESQDFFLLGGDSLVAMELAARYESETGEDFPLEGLFVDGTYGSLKKAVGNE